MISLVENLRKLINQLDEEILKLLSKRKNLVKEVGKLKESLDLPVFDKKREQEILSNITKRAKQLGLDIDSVFNIFGSIFQSSRNEQQKQMPKIECNIKKIGLVGFGRFGKLIIRHLSSDFEFYIYDKKNKKKEIRKNNATPATFNEACRQDIVILAVPISDMENTLKNIKNLLKKNSILIDVCSVKEYPVKLMKSILPKHVQILATHPMFGPDTAADTLDGRKIVLCKVRIQNKIYSQIKRFLESRQLNVIETTPEKHDEEIAKSLVLTHFIGRSLMAMGISNLSIDTQGYKKLMEVLETVKHDTLQLFEDMNKHNRFSNNVRENFIKSAIKLNKKLGIRY